MRIFVIFLILAGIVFGGYYAYQRYGSNILSLVGGGGTSSSLPLISNDSLRSFIQGKTSFPIVGEKTFVITEEYISNLIKKEIESGNNTTESGSMKNSSVDIKNDGTIVFDADLSKPIVTHLTLVLRGKLVDKKVIITVEDVIAGDTFFSSPIEKTIEKLISPFISTLTSGINKINYNSLIFYDDRIELEAERLLK